MRLRLYITYMHYNLVFVLILSATCVGFGWSIKYERNVTLQERLCDIDETSKFSSVYANKI